MFVHHRKLHEQWQRTGLSRQPQPCAGISLEAKWKMRPDIYQVPARREGDDVQMDKLSIQPICIQRILSSKWLLRFSET